MNTLYKFNTPFTLSKSHPDWKQCVVTSVTIELNQRSFVLTDAFINLYHHGGSSMATTVVTLQDIDGISFKFRIVINAMYHDESCCLLFNAVGCDFLRMEIAQHVDLLNKKTVDMCVAVFNTCQTAKLTQFSLKIT
jgi:hypothetical protein